MRAITLALCLVVAIAGCNRSNSLSSARQGVPTDLEGVWIWKVGTAACTVLDGFMSSADGDQFFFVNQMGNDLSADFVDTAGNSVTFSGTLLGNSVQGTFTIIENGGVAGCVGEAYVSNTDDDTVSVIDLATNTEVAVIDVGSNPRGLDITPDGSLVFVANRNANTVSVIRTSDHTVIATIPLTGRSPEGLAIRNDGLLVAVVNRGTDSVDYIDTFDNTVVTSISGAPSNARDADFLPAGSKLYVVGEGGVAAFPGSVCVGDPVPAIANTGGRDVVTTPDGTRVYVARGPSNGTVTGVNTSTDTVTGDIMLSTFGAYGIALCNNGRYAYVTDDDSQVVVVDLQTMTEIDDITVGATCKFIKIREFRRTITLRLTGLTAFSQQGAPMLDGSSNVTTDDAGICDGEELSCWVFAGQGPV